MRQKVCTTHLHLNWSSYYNNLKLPNMSFWIHPYKVICTSPNSASKFKAAKDKQQITAQRRMLQDPLSSHGWAHESVFCVFLSTFPEENKVLVSKGICPCYVWGHLLFISKSASDRKQNLIPEQNRKLLVESSSNVTFFVGTILNIYRFGKVAHCQNYRKFA